MNIERDFFSSVLEQELALDNLSMKDSIGSCPEKLAKIASDIVTKRPYLFEQIVGWRWEHALETKAVLFDPRDTSPKISSKRAKIEDRASITASAVGYCPLFGLSRSAFRART